MKFLFLPCNADESVYTFLLQELKYFNFNKI